MRPADMRCEQCGAPAVVVVVDSEETEPTLGEDGNLWTSWKPAGAHAYCAAHKRPGAEKPGPWRSMTGDELDALRIRLRQEKERAT